MRELLLTGFLTILGALAVNTVTALSVMAYVFNRMNRDYTRIWNELGAPSFIYNNSMKTNIDFAVLIWKNRYEETEDRKIMACANVLKTCYIAKLLLLLAYIIPLSISIYYHIKF